MYGWVWLYGFDDVMKQHGIMGLDMMLHLPVKEAALLYRDACITTWFFLHNACFCVFFFFLIFHRPTSHSGFLYLSGFYATYDIYIHTHKQMSCFHYAKHFGINPTLLWY